MTRYVAESEILNVQQIAPKKSDATDNSDAPGRRRSRLPLFVVSGALLIVALWMTAAAYFLFVFRDQALQMSRQDAADYSVVAAGQVSRAVEAIAIVLDEISERVSKLPAVAARSGTTSITARETFEFLVDRLTRLKQADVVTITDATGKVLAITRGWPAPDVNLSDRDYFIKAKAGERGLIISVPVPNKVTGTMTTYFVRRLDNSAGEFIGVVLVGVRPELFIETGRGGGFDNRTTLLARNDGVVLMHSTTPTAVGQVFPAGSTWYGLVKAGGGSFNSDGIFERRPRIIVVRPIAGLPLVINVSITERNALGHWLKLRDTLAAIAIISFVIFAALLVLILRQLKALTSSRARLKTANALAEQGWRQARAEAVRSKAARLRTLRMLQRLRLSKQNEAAAIAMRDERVRFLATMSHEIRTPLNGIIGVLDLIGTARPEKIPKLLKTASESAEALLVIVSDVLDLSKLEQVDASACNATFQPRELLRNVETALAPIAWQKGIALTTSFDERIATTLRGEPWKLRQVLINLVGNALKFTESGSVSVTVSMCSPADDQGKIGVELVVADTGPGISTTDLPSIFDAFFTGGGNAQRHAGSSGLGLAIVKKSVAGMGGTIAVDSKVGFGSTFRVALSFAIAEEAPVKQSAIAIDNAPLPACSILLVEDNRTNAAIFQDMLEDTQHGVLWAKDGYEGVAVALANDFDVIVMDISMPGIDGIEACRRIRTGRALPHTRIMALTANAIAGDRERLLGAGFDHYLSKPVRRAQLLEALAEVMRDMRRSEGAAPDALPLVEPIEKPPVVQQAPLLDAQAFAAFLGERKPARATRTLGIFVEELAEKRQQLSAIAARRDRKALEMVAHSLLGSGSMIGTTRLVEFGRSLETRSRLSDFDGWADITDLEAVIDLTIAALAPHVRVTQSTPQPAIAAA